MNYPLAQAIHALAPSATEEIENAVKELQRSGVSDLASLGVGEPGFPTPAHIVRAAQRALERGETKYQPTGGAHELRELIAAKLKERNGICASPEDVLVTPGAKFAVYLAFQALLEPGDRVVVLDPCWVSYPAMAGIFGAQSVRVSLHEADGFQLDLPQIKRALDSRVKIVVVNSPCNPTGAVYPREALRELADLTASRGALLLSDEVYEEMVFEGAHYSPGSEYEHVITVSGFSKTYAMTGWRLGYIVGSANLMQGMQKIMQHSASCVAGFAQAGAIEALKSAESGRAVAEMLAGYRSRRKTMLDLLARSEFLNRAGAQGAFYCFPSYRLRASSLDLAKELLHAMHVATVPGSAFGETGEGHLRLSYSASESEIKEAMARIEAYLQRRSRRER